MYALIKAEKKSKRAIASIIISAATTGLSSSTVSFDYDVDPTKRAADPDFYGYIPYGFSRTVIFFCMVANSMLLLLVRSFCAAMLIQVNIKYFTWYCAGDMGLYLLYKFARRDFYHWFPIDGGLGVFVSLLMRTTLKTLVDYTGIVQMRGMPRWAVCIGR